MIAQVLRVIDNPIKKMLVIPIAIGMTSTIVCCVNYLLNL